MTELAGPAAEQGSRLDPSVSPSLVRNTAYNACATVVSLAVGFFLSPVLLASLGLERFGLWSLLWAITGSLGLVDLRVAYAVTPLMAAAWARGERGRAVGLVNTGLVFYAALGLVLVGVAAVGVQLPALVAWIPELFREEGRFALVAAVAVFALGSVASVFTGALHALQRFDLTARITMATTGLRGVSLVAVALAGGGLRGLLLVEAAISCGQLVVTGQAVRRLLPDCRLLRAPDPGAFRELVAFGGKLQVAHAGHLVSLHADKLLLSAFLGLGAVAYYELGQKVAYVIRGLPLLLISATMPVVSTMEARGERERLWHFYLASVRAVVFAAIPLLVFTVTGAGHILMAWAGVEAVEARQAVWLLALGYFFYQVSATASLTSVGMNRPGLEMRRSLLAGTVNLLGSAVFIPMLGFPGAPLGTAVSLVAGAAYLMRQVRLDFGQSASSVVGVLRRPVALALPTAAGASLILWLTEGGRGITVVALAGAALIIGVPFLLLGIREGVVPSDWLRSIPLRLRRPTTRV